MSVETQAPIAHFPAEQIEQPYTVASDYMSAQARADAAEAAGINLRPNENESPADKAEDPALPLPNLLSSRGRAAALIAAGAHIEISEDDGPIEINSKITEAYGDATVLVIESLGAHIDVKRNGLLEVQPTEHRVRQITQGLRDQRHEKSPFHAFYKLGNMIVGRTVSTSS